MNSIPISIVTVLILLNYYRRVMKEETSPTFIVTGGVRCATGWIRACLSEHPMVYMQPKETHYFDQNYDKGLEWYSEFFKESGEKAIIGEKTASYLHHATVAERIHDSIPDVRLVFCLRDPVERMYSHYAMSASSDEKLIQSGFLDSIEVEPKLLEWGKYYTQLEPFLSLFPRENILIKIYEDMEKDPFAFLSEIYAFIEADPNFKAPSTQVRTKLGQLEHNSLFWSTISRIMLHPRAPFFLRSLYTSIRPDEKRDILTEKVYRRFSDYYRDDMINLENYLGRNLDVWRTRRAVVG